MKNNNSVVNYERRVHITAVFCKKELVAVGRNLGDYYYGMFSRHSEQDAVDNVLKLRSLRPDIWKRMISRGIDIVNFGFNMNGDLKISKPCINCAKRLKTLSAIVPIRRVWWSITIKIPSSDESSSDDGSSDDGSRYKEWQYGSVDSIEVDAIVSKGELFRVRK